MEQYKITHKFVSIHKTQVMDLNKNVIFPQILVIIAHQALTFPF